MKKRILNVLILTFVLIFCFVITACSSKKETSDSTTLSNTNSITIVTESVITEHNTDEIITAPAGTEEIDSTEGIYTKDENELEIMTAPNTDKEISGNNGDNPVQNQPDGTTYTFASEPTLPFGNSDEPIELPFVPV